VSNNSTDRIEQIGDKCPAAPRNSLVFASSVCFGGGKGIDVGFDVTGSVGVDVILVSVFVLDVVVISIVEVLVVVVEDGEMLDVSNENK